MVGMLWSVLQYSCHCCIVCPVPHHPTTVDRGGDSVALTGKSLPRLGVTFVVHWYRYLDIPMPFLSLTS